MYNETKGDISMKYLIGWFARDKYFRHEREKREIAKNGMTAMQTFKAAQWGLFIITLLAMMTGLGVFGQLLFWAWLISLIFTFFIRGLK